MQILVAGKTYQAKKIAEFLSQDKNDIVFSGIPCENSTLADINLNSPEDIKEFVQANDVGLIVFPHLIKEDFEEMLMQTECVAFYLDSRLSKLCKNVSSAKKYAYKCQIKTSKFAVFEKLPPAIEYIQSSDMPLIIVPDSLNFKEAPYIADTKTKARLKAEEMFQTGNKKVLLENYIQGPIYTKYVMLDSCSVSDLFDTVSYFEEFATNKTECISNEAKNSIKNEIIPVLIENLMEEETEHTGIFGVSFIIDKTNTPYFLKFEPFIKELDIDIFLNTIKTPLKEILCACAEEKAANLKIEFNNKYSISANINNEYVNVCANTMNKALDLIKIEGADEKNLYEGIKLWQR